MTLAAQRQRQWVEFGVDQHDWVVSGSFALDGANYTAEFHGDAELGRFLDFLFAAPTKPATSRLYLHEAVEPRRPEHELSNLRFQFDAEHNAAAAVILLLDQNNQLSTWITAGGVNADNVVLAHDSWNEHETLFPPGAFITVPQLREAVLQWAFGPVVPPPAVTWTDASGIDWF